MKRLLIASVATAALALAAPAFAQVGVGETVQGAVTTPDVSTVPPPITEATEPAAAPHTVTGEMTAEATSPVTTAQADTQTTVTTPDARPAVSAAEDTATAMTEGSDATVTADANAAADAPTRTAEANASASAAATTDLPQQVQVAVADGRYTTDDLNRAQLQALQGDAGR